MTSAAAAEAASAGTAAVELRKVTEGPTGSYAGRGPRRRRRRHSLAPRWAVLSSSRCSWFMCLILGYSESLLRIEGENIQKPTYTYIYTYIYIYIYTYAQILILVNLIVVNLFSCFNSTRNGLAHFRQSLDTR